jgi:hypothetical protein
MASVAAPTTVTSRPGVGPVSTKWVRRKSPRRAFPPPQHLRSLAATYWKGLTMHAAEGHVATERASRYLVQLCEHIHLVTQANPQMPARAAARADASCGPNRAG